MDQFGIFVVIFYTCQSFGNESLFENVMETNFRNYHEMWRCGGVVHSDLEWGELAIFRVGTNLWSSADSCLKKSFNLIFYFL